MGEYRVASLESLIDQFEKFPSVGHKTASRLAYHVLSMTDDDIREFSETIAKAHQNIRHCKICCNLTDTEICSVCSDSSRDKSIICVVEDFRDVIALERTKEFNVTYHVLNGVLSPINGITPDMICADELLARLQDGIVKEVIMATNATVEGEATAMYLSKRIKPLGIKVTRLAYGLPVGVDLEYADEVTLSHALSGRNEVI